MTPARGEIVLEHASRSFPLVQERSRTLKEVFVRRGRGGQKRVHALRDVDLRIAPGEAVGMVGRNGAGKTSTLRCLGGIVPLDSGRAECGGRVAALLELGAGFGPEFTGRENIYLNGALHGLERHEMEERADAIVEFSELGEFIDVPVKAYSAGMFLRLGFSIVAHLDADVLLIDEILAVGDEAFQRKCLRRVAQTMDRGATLMLVSHDPGVIERICRRLVVLDGGSVAFDGDVAEGLLFYHRMLGTESAGSEVLRPRGAGAELQISELELRDEAGRRRRLFRSGEPLRAELAVSSQAPLERAVLALEVRDQRGALCFRTETALGALDGVLAVTFEVPSLPLLGGDYDLAVGAYEQNAPGGVLLDRVARFSVPHTSEAEGVADLRGTWTVGGGRAPAALERDAEGASR